MLRARFSHCDQKDIRRHRHRDRQTVVTQTDRRDRHQQRAPQCVHGRAPSMRAGMLTSWRKQ
eukprot:2783558-Lingulodinium_polyedra.AAC.1